MVNAALMVRPWTALCWSPSATAAFRQGATTDSEFKHRRSPEHSGGGGKCRRTTVTQLEVQPWRSSTVKAEGWTVTAAFFAEQLLFLAGVSCVHRAVRWVGCLRPSEAKPAASRAWLPLVRFPGVATCKWLFPYQPWLATLFWRATSATCLITQCYWEVDTAAGMICPWYPWEPNLLQKCFSKGEEL